MSNFPNTLSKHNTLASKFAVRLVEDMDMDTLVTIAIESLHQQFYTEYTPEQLRTEIEENGCYDDLLEQEQQ